MELINKKSNAIYFLISFLLILGLVRIVFTYSVFWQTWDEPAHIGAGLEWWSKGEYTYELMHPPLARILNSLGLDLQGLSSPGLGMW